MKKQFKFYLFNVSVNDLSVAVYESDYSYELIVENQDGEEVSFCVDGMTFYRYNREFITKNFLFERSVSEYMSEKFLEDEDDMYYNEAKALHEVLNGLDKSIGEQPDFSENGE